MLKTRFSKLFKRLSLTVVSIGTLGGVVGAVVACGSSSSASQTDASATDITKDRSDIQEGLYKGNDKQIDLVALGDSVTAGYTTLEYDGRTKDGDNRNGSYSAYLSRILGEQKSNSEKGRLKSYTNLAVSGAKTADLLSVIDSPTNSTTLENADLFVGTIGANDLLQSVLIGGIPYRVIADMIEGEPFKLPINTEAIGNPFAAILELNALATDTKSAFQDVFAGKMGAMFRISTSSLIEPQFKDVFEKMKLNFESIIQKLHQKSPKAMLIFNKYIYPFNRYLQNGKDITDMTYKSDAVNYHSKLGLPLEVLTFHDAYDYAMLSLQKIAEKYSFVTWNDMQKDEDEIVVDLVKAGTFSNESDALRLMQADKADIHPTEYAHALTAKKLYNDLLADSLGEKISDSYFDDIKLKVASATLGQTQRINNIADFLLKNDPTGENTPPDNALASAMVNLFTERLEEAVKKNSTGLLTGSVDLESVLATTPYAGLFNFVSAGAANEPVDEAQTNKALSDAFADAFFRPNDSSSANLRSKISAPGSIKPVFTVFGSDGAVDWAVKYLPVALVNYYNNDPSIYDFLTFKEKSTGQSDNKFTAQEETAIRTYLKFTDADFADKASFKAALRRFYEDPANIDKWMAEGFEPIPGSTTDTSLNSLVQQSNSQAEHLRRIAALANGFAVNMPEAFYSNYKAGDTLKPLTLADLQLEDGKFNKITLVKQ